MSQFSDDEIIAADPADYEAGPPKRMVPMAVLGIVLAAFLLMSNLLSIPGLVIMAMGIDFGPQVNLEAEDDGVENSVAKFQAQLNEVQRDSIPLWIVSLLASTVMAIYLLISSIAVVGWNHDSAFRHYRRACCIGFCISIVNLVLTSVLQFQLLQAISFGTEVREEARFLTQWMVWSQWIGWGVAAVFLIGQMVYLGLGWKWSGQILAAEKESSPGETPIPG